MASLFFDVYRFDFEDEFTLKAKNILFKNGAIQKNVLIVGMGKSGVAAYNALRTLGSKISIQDSKELNREDFPGATCYFSKMPDDFWLLYHHQGN